MPQECDARQKEISAGGVVRKWKKVWGEVEGKIGLVDWDFKACGGGRGADKVAARQRPRVARGGTS